MEHWSLRRDEEQEEKERNHTRASAQAVVYDAQIRFAYFKKFDKEPKGFSTWEIEQALK